MVLNPPEGVFANSLAVLATFIIYTNLGPNADISARQQWQPSKRFELQHRQPVRVDKWYLIPLGVARDAK